MHVDTLKFFKYQPIKKPIYQGKFCRIPFDTLQIDWDGDVQLCDCQLHMPYTIGNIFQNSLSDIWTNSQAQLVRQAVIDGDFTYCSWDCSRLPTLTPHHGVLPKVRNFPNTIKIDLDRSCNLKCPSCRETVIIEKQSDKIQKQIQLFDEIKQWALANPQNTVTVIPLGSGEIFASHSGMKFLESLVDYPHQNLKLHLTTNGTLITKNKELLTNIKHLIKSWSISIDAATPETYAQVRGGDWSALMNGLKFIGSIRQSLGLKFVVQQKNWHEITAFAELAANHNSGVYFSNLLDWGHWTIQWWKDNDVVNNAGDHYHNVLQQLQQVKNKYPNRMSFSADIIEHLNKVQPLGSA